MTFKQTPLYPKKSFSVPLHIRILIAFIAVSAPVHAFGLVDKLRGTEPFQQQFIITGYYSPLEGQCCYATGGLEAEKRMNGQGTHAADGTPVYPGMIAAPGRYPFGTVIDLPGFGVFKVHDRGGAIVTKSDGKDRLDIWTGHDEEGLARAVNVGFTHLAGTVYPVGSKHPPVSVDLANLPSPLAALEQYNVHDKDLLSQHPVRGQRGRSVLVMQEAMRKAGYYPGEPTGHFDDQTHVWLTRFIRDFGIREPSDKLTKKTAAYLMAAAHRGTEIVPLDGFVNDGASPAHVANAQRLLRFLSYYPGRTNGDYDETTKAAIFRFQKSHGLVGDWSSPGAGNIGPLTSEKLRGEWNRVHVERLAQKRLDYHQAYQRLSKKSGVIDEFLYEGENNSDVRRLQEFLASKNFFPKGKINGNFGELTKESVIKYQLSKGVIRHRSSPGAGNVGPITLRSIQRDVNMEVYGLVRAKGWSAL